MVKNEDLDEPVHFPNGTVIHDDDLMNARINTKSFINIRSVYDKIMDLFI